MDEVSSKLTIKTPKRRCSFWPDFPHGSSVSIVDFEQVDTREGI